MSKKKINKCGVYITKTEKCNKPAVMYMEDLQLKDHLYMCGPHFISSCKAISKAATSGNDLSPLE